MTIVLNTSLSGVLGPTQSSESEPGQDVPASEMSFTKLMEGFAHGENSPENNSRNSETLSDTLNVKLQGTFAEPALEENLRAEVTNLLSQTFPAEQPVDAHRSNVPHILLDTGLSEEYLDSLTTVSPSQDLVLNPDSIDRPQNVTIADLEIILGDKGLPRLNRFTPPHDLSLNLGGFERPQNATITDLEIILSDDDLPRLNRMTPSQDLSLSLDVSGRPENSALVNLEPRITIDEDPTRSLARAIEPLVRHDGDSVDTAPRASNLPGATPIRSYPDLIETVTGIPSQKPTSTPVVLVSDPEPTGVTIAENGISRAAPTLPLQFPLEQSLPTSGPTQNVVDPTFTESTKQDLRTQVAQRLEPYTIQELDTPHALKAPTPVAEAPIRGGLMTATQPDIRDAAPAPQVPSLAGPSIDKAAVVESTIIKQTLTLDNEQQIIPSASRTSAPTLSRTDQPVLVREHVILNAPIERETLVSTVTPPQIKEAAEAHIATTARDAVPPTPTLDEPVLEAVKSQTDRIEFKSASAAGLMTADVTKPVLEPLPQLFSATTAPIENTSKPASVINVASPTAAQSGQPAALQTVGQNLIQAIVSQSGVSVRLDPPEMGNVSINFQFDAERGVTAIVRSELVETSIFLKERAEILQQTLKDSGFDSVNLSFEHGHTSSNNSDPSGQQFQNTDPKFGAYDISEDSNMANLISYNRNYTVDDQIDLRL